MSLARARDAFAPEKEWYIMGGCRSRTVVDRDRITKCESRC